MSQKSKSLSSVRSTRKNPSNINKKALPSLRSTRKYASNVNMKKKALPPIGNKTRKSAPESAKIGQIIVHAENNPDEPRQLRSTSKSPRRTGRQRTPPKPSFKSRNTPIVPEQENNKVFKDPDTGAVTTERKKLNPGRFSGYYENKS